MKILKEESRHLATYVLILVVFLLMLNVKIGEIKGEINATVRGQCQSGNTARILGQYNDAVQVLIDGQKEAQGINLRAGRTHLAVLNAKTAARLSADQIRVPKTDCSKPLLP